MENTGVWFLKYVTIVYIQVSTLNLNSFGQITYVYSLWLFNVIKQLYQKLLIWYKKKKKIKKNSIDKVLQIDCAKYEI